MAKTQNSISTDPNLKGAPSNHVTPISAIRIANGAQFLVVIRGDMMTMPGLPRAPAANNIRIAQADDVDGRFQQYFKRVGITGPRPIPPIVHFHSI